jgi:hypothetical protein
MSQKLIATAQTETNDRENVYLLLGAGLAVASMILIPAMATRIGLGSSLTAALRIALMKASSRATAVASTHERCDIS